MRTSILLVIVLLHYVSAGIRPASFGTEQITLDEEGFFRKSMVHSRGLDAKPEDDLDYTARFHKNVVFLDREQYINSIKCHGTGNLVIEVAPGALVKEWDSSMVLYGGKEWGCLNEDGHATRFAIKPSNVHRAKNMVFVRGDMADQKEVFETLKMAWQSPTDHAEIDMKRLWRNQNFNMTTGWNWDDKKQASKGPVTLKTFDCSEKLFQSIPPIKRLCDAKYKVTLKLSCVDCWAKLGLNMSFIYDQESHDKDLTSIGVLQMNMTIEVEASISMQYTFENLARFDIPLPYVTLSIPGVADIGVTVTLAIDVTLKWNIVGKASVGAFMEGNFVTAVGSKNRDSSFDFKPTPNRPAVSVYGDASAQFTFRIGPHFQVRLLVIRFFDAFTELQPFVNFGVHYDMMTMEPKDVPNPKTLVKMPWMVQDCKRLHFVEWSTGFGVQISVGVKGPIIPTNWTRNFLLKQWDLAAGCLFPIGD